MIVNANDVSNPATLVPFVVKIREKSSRLRFPLAVPAPAAALGIDDGGRSRKSHNEMPLPPLSLSLCLCVLKLAIFPSLSRRGIRLSHFLVINMGFRADNKDNSIKNEKKPNGERDG